MPDNAYTHEFDNGQKVATILNRLGANSGDPLEIALACHSDAEFNTLPIALQSEVTTLLGFELDDDPADGSVVLTPEVGPRQGLRVRAIADATAESHELWRSVLGHSDVAILNALLCDALLTARANADAEHASRTVLAYTSLSNEGSIDSLHVALAIARANTIARRRRMAEEEMIRNEARRFSIASLDAARPDGVVARVLAALSRTPLTYAISDSERGQIRSLLDRAAQTYNDPSSADWIADCRRTLATSEDERLAATREQVAAYLATAESDEMGFRKMHWATQAADIAGRYGDRESHGRAIRLIQSIPADSMGWTAHEAVVTLPVSALRSHVRRYKFSTDWRHALRLFLASKSPAGNHDKNKATSRASAAGSIRSLVSRVTFGQHGLPERSDGDFDEEELVRTEQFAIGTQGILLELELREIERRFGRPPQPEIASWLSATFGCDDGRARYFAHSLHLFWNGESSDSARIAIPLIESAARGLLLLLDEPLYRLERGASPGRFPAMDYYVDKLEALGMDIDWIRALRTTLLDPGMNLRNMAAHGFKFEFAASETAVLIRLAGLFCAMPVKQESEVDATTLRNPTEFVRRPLRRRVGVYWA
jgi:hypothetical protein